MRKQLLRSLMGFIFLFVSAQVTSQPHYQRCATDEYTSWLRSVDPASADGMDQANRSIEEWLDRNPNYSRGAGQTIVIPVVVHVLYNTASQNISDEMIKSQLDVLNEDFGGYNSDYLKTPPFFRDRRAHDTGIRFELARRDPNGNATNGIVRKQTTVTAFGMSNAMKYDSQGGSNAWNSSHYLNIWVCNINNLTLGFAQFPGGNPNTDGVVIQFNAFGRISSLSPYNYGRTATHEIGHWLNLFHINGDANCGNDQVADTPPQAALNGGCPTCHGFTCNNQPTGDMYMNYMDYSDDKCLYMFTQGQAARMWAAINTYRSSLFSSPALNAVTTPTLDAGITEITSPAFAPCDFATRSFIPEITLKNFGTSTLTSVTINYRTDNGTVNTYNWTGSLASGATTSITLPQQNLGASNPATDHIFYAWTSNPNGGTDENPVNDRTTRNFIGHAVNAAFPITQGFETTPYPPLGWTLRNYDCATGWQRLTTAAHSGSYSIVYNNFTQSSVQMGVMDDMIIQPVDMSAAPSNAAFRFWVAYATRNNNQTDTLEILASSDCGKTYTSIFKKWGNALATAPPNNSAAFVPSSAEWREEIVSLSPYVGVKNLMIAIRNIHGGGNNLYIDDIGVVTTSVAEIESGIFMSVYPNPVNDKLFIRLHSSTPIEGRILMTDIYGKVLYTVYLKAHHHQLVVDAQGLASGFYFVRAETSMGRLTRKVTVLH
jgi:hypothetical protein